MKTLSQRETRLLFLTCGILVLVLTLWVARRQLQAHRDRGQRRMAAETSWLLQEQALGMRPESLSQLQRIRAQLPRHPVGRDLKSTLSRQVQTLAAASGLTLTDLTPEPEEYLANLEVYQTAIRCGWRGNTLQLEEFLTRLQQLGPVLDVQTLRLRRRPGGARTEITGTFTLEFVYTREEVGSASGGPPEETTL